MRQVELGEERFEFFIREHFHLSTMGLSEWSRTRSSRTKNTGAAKVIGRPFNCVFSFQPLRDDRSAVVAEFCSHKRCRKRFAKLRSAVSVEQTW